jgi:hypothetical protein
LRRPELIEGADPVLLLTPGKVGTKTVAAALRSAGIEALAAHSFGPALSEAMRTIARSRPLPDARRKLTVGLRVDAELELARLYEAYRPQVVSLVREPIARAVSGYFQGFAPGRLDELCATRDQDELTQEMLGQVRASLPAAIRRVAAWYRDLLPHATGVEVPPFEPGAAFSIFETDRARVLFMPLERADAMAEALEAFIGRPVRIKPRNITETKHPALAGIRRRIEASLAPDPALVEEAYADPVIRAVYDEATLAGFRERWLKPEAAEG